MAQWIRLHAPKKQIPYANTHIWNLKKNGSDEPSGRAGIKTQT